MERGRGAWIGVFIDSHPLFLSFFLSFFLSVWMKMGKRKEERNKQTWERRV